MKLILLTYLNFYQIAYDRLSFQSFLRLFKEQQIYAVSSTNLCRRYVSNVCVLLDSKFNQRFIKEIPIYYAMLAVVIQTIILMQCLANFFNLQRHSKFNIFPDLLICCAMRIFRFLVQQKICDYRFSRGTQFVRHCTVLMDAKRPRHKSCFKFENTFATKVKKVLMLIALLINTSHFLVRQKE